jgi:hypothetical protein
MLTLYHERQGDENESLKHKKFREISGNNMENPKACFPGAGYILNSFRGGDEGLSRLLRPCSLFHSESTRAVL